MSIFSRLFKKRKDPESFDNFEVVLRTDKKLTEEQENAIISIVKDGIESGEDLSSICILIMMTTDINDPIILNRFKNSVEVVIF